MVSVWIVRIENQMLSIFLTFFFFFFHLKIWNSTLKNSLQEFALLFLNLKINAWFFKRILFEVVRNFIINFFTESSIVGLMKIFLFSIIKILLKKEHISSKCCDYWWAINDGFFCLLYVFQFIQNVHYLLAKQKIKKYYVNLIGLQIFQVEMFTFQ